MPALVFYPHVIELPEGFEDESRYQFATSAESVFVIFEASFRKEDLDAWVDAVKRRASRFLGSTHKWIQDEGCSFLGFPARILAYEIKEGEEIVRFRHIFAKSQEDERLWIQLVYQGKDLAWSEIDPRFSIEEIQPSISFLPEPPPADKSNFYAGSLGFCLPSDFQNRSLYRFVNADAGIEVMVEELSDPQKPAPNPVLMRLEGTGIEVESIARPADGVQSGGYEGSWFRSRLVIAGGEWEYAYGVVVTKATPSFGSERRESSVLVHGLSADISSASQMAELVDTIQRSFDVS